MSLETTAENSQGQSRCSVVVRSRHRQRRPEEFGRQQSTTVYDGQSVMMMTLSEDDLEPRGPNTGGTRERVTMTLFRANISTSGQRVFLLDAAWKVKPTGGDCLASPVTTSLQSLPRAI